jgi:hypothetical protein
MFLFEHPQPSLKVIFKIAFEFPCSTAFKFADRYEPNEIGGDTFAIFSLGFLKINAASDLEQAIQYTPGAYLNFVQGHLNRFIFQCLIWIILENPFVLEIV